jgi:phage tail-like protein
MPTTNDSVTGDALIANHIAIEIGGKISGFFTSISGLGSETAVIDHKIVAKGSVPVDRKVAGRLSWGDITLKRGVTTNLDFWQWRQEVVTGNVAKARMDGSIIMYSQEGTEVARWNFEKAWPSKVSGPEASAEGNDIAVEEVVIVHEGIERVT